MKSYKNLLVILLIIIIVLVSLLVLYFLNHKPKRNILDSFNITSVERNDNIVTIYYEECKNAKRYVVTILDEDDNILLQKESNTNSVTLDEFYPNYGDKLKIKATAFNINEEQVVSANIYEYVWENPSFNLENNSYIVSKNKDYIINLKGDINPNEYKIKILYNNNNVLYSTNITEETLKIPYYRIKNYDGKLTAILYDMDDHVINKMNFYNNPILVTKVTISSPTYNEDLYWDEVIVNFDGGNNANVFKANIYVKNKLINTVDGEKSVIKIPATTFKENQTYRIEVLAIYGDYIEIAQKTDVQINIGEKRKVEPVYVNRSTDHIKLGDQVELKSRTKNATIKYTLDGSNPVKEGIVYIEPITINKNTKIKTVAIKDNLDNSEILDFDFRTGNEPLVVYLSPSNQWGNLGVSRVGYTNEKEMMNKVADYVQKNLEEKGVKVLRNDPNKDMMIWLSESRNAHADLHLAIHSNGSKNHDTKGMEIYVDDATCKHLSLATLMYTNLFNIYPYRSLETDRGVKYAEGSLGEVNLLNTKVGILIEIAHHDDADDAKWMVDNLEQISNNISSTILSYYGIS